MKIILNFIKERLAGLYYATSVAGYGSDSSRVVKYLRNNTQNHWGDVAQIVFPVGLLRCPDEPDKFNKAVILLSEIMDSFPDKRIDILALLSSEISTTDCMAGKLFSKITGDSNPTVPHRSYVKISMYPAQGLMSVKVVDSMFNPDKPLIRTLMASPEPLPVQSKKLFQNIAQALGLKLSNYRFIYRGDQVLNFHDCTRFSLIYLEAELAGSECMKLSNMDIYQGFKKLEAGGYTELNQTATEDFPRPFKQSRFVTYITNPILRYLPDLVLKA